MRNKNWKFSFSWLRCGMLCDVVCYLVCMLCGVVCYLVWYVMWCGILFVCMLCGVLCGVVCYVVWCVMWCGILFVCMLCGVVCYLVWYHWQWWTNYSCEGDVTVSPAQDPGVCLLSGPASTPTSQPASFLIFNLNKRERIWQRSSSSGQIVSIPVRTTLTPLLWHNIQALASTNISFSYSHPSQAC